MNQAASCWPITRLGKIISHRKEFIEIDDTEKYKRCRVQLHAKGIVLRDEVEGITIKTKKQQVCRAGELLVAEIDAKVGGFGIVPTELEGAIVSSHYFLYTLNPLKIESAFINYFVKTPFFRDQVKAQGSTNYAAIRPNQVLDYEIPLPPVSEQHRIVAKIKRLTGKVEEAQRLRGQNDTSTNKIISGILAKIIGRLEEKFGTIGLEDIIINAGYGTSKKCFSDRMEGSTPILRIPNVISEKISNTNLKYTNLSEKELEKVGLRVGDLLIVRTNGSADLVGRCAVVKALNEPTGFASYLIRIQPDTKKISSDYLQRCLWHMRVSGQLFDLARTTAGQYNVSLGRIRPGRIPLPSLEEQKSIIEYLDDLQTKIDDLKAIQAKTAVELDAMLPSILDKAFKGEL